MTVITTRSEATIASVLARFQDQKPLNAAEAKEVVKTLTRYEASDEFESGTFAESIASALSVQDTVMTQHRGTVLRALPVRDASPEALAVFENFAHQYGVEFNYQPADPKVKPQMTRRMDATGHARMSIADLRTWENTGKDPNAPAPRVEPAPNFKPKRPPHVDEGRGMRELVGNYDD